MDVCSVQRKEKDKKEVKETTGKAIDVCRKVRKPSQEDRVVLNKLFPSRSSHSAFNPKKESCAEINKLKKKAAIPKKGGKSRTITAVLFKKLPSKVPKGACRKKLSDEGRINKIQIRRSMTPSEIKDVISSSFSSFSRAKDVKFVKCDQANTLGVVADSMLDGNETANLAGGGSLYLLEVSAQIYR